MSASHVASIAVEVRVVGRVFIVEAQRDELVQSIQQHVHGLAQLRLRQIQLNPPLRSSRAEKGSSTDLLHLEHAESVREGELPGPVSFLQLVGLPDPVPLVFPVAADEETRLPRAQRHLAVRILLVPQHLDPSLTLETRNEGMKRWVRAALVECESASEGARSLRWAGAAQRGAERQRSLVRPRSGR